MKLTSLLFIVSTAVLLTSLLAFPSTHASSETVGQGREGVIPIQSANNVLCEGCEVVIGLAEAFVTRNSTVDDLEKFLDLVCPFLQPDYRIVCPMMIKAFGQEIVDLLIERENPTHICTDFFHLC